MALNYQQCQALLDWYQTEFGTPEWQRVMDWLWEFDGIPTNADVI